jgi:hypothetical protein
MVPASRVEEENVHKRIKINDTVDGGGDDNVEGNDDNDNGEDDGSDDNDEDDDDNDNGEDDGSDDNDEDDDDNDNGEDDGSDDNDEDDDDNDNGEDDGGDENNCVESGGGGKSSAPACRKNLYDGIPAPNPRSVTYSMDLAVYCARVHAQTRKNDGDEDSQPVGMKIVKDSNESYESGDSETVLLEDDNKLYDGDENLIIDKLSGLKMSINNTETETNQADFSSSSNLCTIAYDDIASLLSIVKSGHELFYEETVTPEMKKKWYQNLLESVLKMSSGTLSSLDSPQNHDLYSTSFDTVLTKDMFAKPDQSVEGPPNEDYASSVSFEPTNDEIVQGSSKTFEENWLKVNFIKELQQITATERSISIKMGLLGYMLPYYESEDKFWKDVFDITTFRPLGTYRQDVHIDFKNGHDNVYYVNHDLFIISSLLQVYVKSHKQCDGDQNAMIEYIMEALKSYRRPFLSLLSHSTESNYGSIDPNGFCAYLAAATSYECAIQRKNPHNLSLEFLKVRICIL